MMPPHYRTDSLLSFITTACQMAHALALKGFTENQLYTEQTPCLNITINIPITITKIMHLPGCHAQSLLTALLQQRQ